MSNFFIELSIVHTTLVAAYWFFLRNENQYAKMRGYLLTATLLAISIPLFKLPKLFSSGDAMTPAVTVDDSPLDLAAVPTATAVESWEIDILLLIYIGITSILLIKLVWSFGYLIVLKQNSRKEKINGRNIQRVKNLKGSFTFFQWIFVEETIDKNKAENQAILKHEEAHVAMGHSYDLMFFELFTAFAWWLPSAWYIRKEIKKIHEYQADAYALESFHIDLYSSILISSTLQSNGLSMASSFHDGLIFKRIKAMKQQVKNVSLWKLGTLISLVATLFVILACSEERTPIDGMALPQLEQQTQRKEFTIVEKQPSFKGGLDAFYQFVMSELRYPAKARTEGIEGRVYVRFVVERDGSITNVQTIKGIGYGCDEEVVRAIKKSPDFIPGSQRGKTVRVQLQMPITFQLSKNERNPDNSAKGAIVVGDISSEIQKFQLDTKYKNGKWIGTIGDSDGNPLPGANFVIEGTKYGTVSDLDGSFSLKADRSQTIRISFVGFESIRLETQE